MSDNNLSLATVYKGWDIYQQHQVKAIAPLTPDQLALQAAPHLRSTGMIATHIIAVRVRWFHGLMGEGGTEIDPIGSWDRAGTPVRTAAELVSGLEVTWQLIQQSLTRWTLTDLDYIFRDTYQGKTYTLSRQWVIWHVIEHDLHHGGELSFALGMHGLAAPDL